MYYPQLVPDKYCKTPISVTIYAEDITEDGEPATVFSGYLMCNWQDCAKTAVTQREKTAVISGEAFFNGDICPAAAVIPGGFVTVFGKKRTIVKGTKARNPDGTVNYTKLELL